MNRTTPLTTRLLMYGHDPILTDTRSSILKMAGFDIHTVAEFGSFRLAVEPEPSPYKLAILCHTVPQGERTSIAEIATQSRMTVFQIETLIAPARLVSEVSRLAGQTAAFQ